MSYERKEVETFTLWLPVFSMFLWFPHPASLGKSLYRYQGGIALYALWMCLQKGFAGYLQGAQQWRPSAQWGVTTVTI